ncbi:MAG: hypothetical protein U5L45_23310 [Saprospiraceae bacterium]|nr:hypothetical protein [Saprospiraceae bacterium]
MPFLLKYQTPQYIAPPKTVFYCLKPYIKSKLLVLALASLAQK